MKSSNQLYKYTAGLTLITGAILLIPLIAMQFNNGVNWTLGDFIFAAVLIFGTGLAYKLTAIRSDNITYKVAVGFALATGFSLIWVNGAVGIIDSEDNLINLYYFGVIAIGLIGAFMVRFRSKGMALVMFVMAFAQALIAAVALIGGYYQSPPSFVVEILGVNGFFLTLFIISALLFRYASQKQLPTNAEG